MATHRFDPDFTDNVINSMGSKTSPRMRQLMNGLIRHVHDFARENELTVDEWMAGMSDNKRNEGQLVCDVIGLESLVDEITFTLAEEAKDAPTATAILGPFFRADTPSRSNSDDIVINKPKDGQIAFMHGQIIDFAKQKPLVGATVEGWEASTNGLYEQQDPEQDEYNLRGKFQTDADGRYYFYYLRPTPYPVPGDGPAGKLLALMDRHPFRPTHIHIMVWLIRRIRYIFTERSTRLLTMAIVLLLPRSLTARAYLENESVFAVKDSLVVDFVPCDGDPYAALELKYDVKLVADTQSDSA
ncbi:hypothetical protein N7520_010269 [Penicillium odoratum]|uniref:uncharacterized protein n=1 Tax=Penicillium odoratum TaxID=1167516 RepID=UPI002548257A|nr:uncharacterized protein N7520_010269 [Penicillium odoratum]KAJ5745087.1 hypothetical protein N7520_010269 [Penicillium odoratum]